MNDGTLNRDAFIEEREIDLKDLLYYIFKKWRRLLLSAVIVMILLLLFRIPVLIKLNSVADVLKQSAKYVVIGVLAGLLLMCFVYAVFYVINGKIKSENEFMTNCRLSVLEVLPKKNSKKLNGIDRLIRRMFGVDRHTEDFDKLTDRLAEEIRAMLSAINGEKNDIKEDLYIGIVSTDSGETASELADLVNSRFNGTAKVVAAGDILKSAESVQTVMMSDKIIMVERIAASRYQKVEAAYKKLEKWQKDIVGVVLVDGDAI